MSIVEAVPGLPWPRPDPKRALALLVATGALCGSAAAATGVVGTLRVSVHETPIFAARGSTLFAFVLPENFSPRVTLDRWNPDGSVSTRQVPVPFLEDVATGPHGVYAGTAVEHRLVTAPDVLVRVDPATLSLRARASFPHRVIPAAGGDRLWASIADGRVVRLDPRTLRVLASRQVMRLDSTDPSSGYVSRPVLGLGSLWVVAGDKLDEELVRLDPATLVVRAKTRLAPASGVNRVIADARHVYLEGTGLIRVRADGSLDGRVPHTGSLATAELLGDTIVGVTNPVPTTQLILLDDSGRVRARIPLRDAGEMLAVSRSNAWINGDGGAGNGIVHLRLGHV